MTLEVLDSRVHFTLHYCKNREESFGEGAMFNSQRHSYNYTAFNSRASELAPPACTVTERPRMFGNLGFYSLWFQSTPPSGPRSSLVRARRPTSNHNRKSLQNPVGNPVCPAPPDPDRMAAPGDMPRHLPLIEHLGSGANSVSTFFHQ